MGTLYNVASITGDITTAGDITAAGGIVSTSTTAGFLPPRLTTTQRNAIVSPATGLQIFNTTTVQDEFYNGTAWAAVGSGSVSSITGTTNQVIASASTGAITLSLPQSIDITSSPTFSNITLSSSLFLQDSTTNTISIKAPITVTPYPLTMPAAQGTVNTLLQNDGSGNLSFFQIPGDDGLPGNTILMSDSTGALSTTDNFSFDASISQLAIVSNMQNPSIIIDSQNLTKNPYILFTCDLTPVDYNINLNSSTGNLNFTTASTPIAGPIVFFADGTAGFGTTTSVASAQLSITSTTKGFLPPRMTTTQRNAISSPATGLQVFNTTTNELEFYNGTAWTAIGGSTNTVTTVATTFTAASANIILANATSAAFTITLPAAASSTNLEYTIKKTDSSVNAVTVKGNASETIDGSNTQILSSQYQSITVVCDGTSWWVI